MSQYEAVHPLRHWRDLKHRVGPNRRCFIFTHRAFPREPIVVLHTALTREPASSVQVRGREGGREGEERKGGRGGGNGYIRLSSYGAVRLQVLLDRTLHGSTDSITTAVFYSISATQKGWERTRWEGPRGGWVGGAWGCWIERTRGWGVGED